jgi:hypothetical protein
MDKSVIATALFATFLCAADAAHSQDTNYWTLQYGTRGELLGGVVVGSAVDLSATFYNPGSLALILNPSSILTATTFGMETINIKDVDPDQDVVSSRRVGPEPSLFAGTLPLHWFGGQMAYSFLTRQKLDFRLTEREGAIIGADETGDTLSLGGEAFFDQNMSEHWGGVTWSKKANDRIGYGATLYGVYRSQTRSIRQTVEALGANGYGASLLNWNDIDYKTFRVLAKVGISADFGATMLGISFTSGGLPVLGNGSILINRVLVGDADGDGIDDSGADVTYGVDLDAEYKSPISVAVGGSYRWTDTSLHATIEYFGAVDPYVVMETPARGTSPGVATHAAAVNDALADVLNWGVGFERRFSEKTTAYIGFITDHSASRFAGQYDVSVSTWDIYHLNGGVAFTLLGTDLTLGGGFAWGSEPLRVTPPSEGDLPATLQPSEVSYSRIKAVLGLAL